MRTAGLKSPGVDLVSGAAYWPIQDGLPASYPSLHDDIDCDVAVLGGGITGALAAYALVGAGASTVVLDRRDIGTGSTAACTALLTYEPDLPLRNLSKRLGAAAATQAYRACRDAVDRIASLVRETGSTCDFSRRESLQFASTPAHVAGLRLECELRKRAGLDVELWTRSKIARTSSLPYQAAILSRGAAQMDPYRFTHGLLKAGERRGLRVFDRTEVTGHRRERKGGVRLHCDTGAHVRAKKLVVAAGYEARAFLHKPVGVLHSTFALITEPMDACPGWPGNRLIWETARPYLYLRRTDDRRVIIGGYDERFRDVRQRDAMLPAKSGALLRRLRQLFPGIPAETAYAWAGTFAETEDSLPLIGPMAGHPDVFIALAYGGNGVISGAIAAEITRDLYVGRPNANMHLFRLDR